MPSFLYYVPKREAGLGANELKALGLCHALDGAVTQQHLMMGGPDGGGGLLLADAEHCDPARVTYAADKQEWLELPGFWLGRWTDEAIAPNDLLRRKPLDGHFVELADGRKWLCPVARTHALEPAGVRWYHALPFNVSMGPDRKWKPGGVVPRYKRLWEINLAWWDAREGAAATAGAVGDTIQFDFDGLYSTAADCLAANYRVGPDEISMLGLFDSGSARKILDALIDLPTIVKLQAELEKKTTDLPPAG